VLVYDGDYASLVLFHPAPALAGRVEETHFELLMNNLRSKPDMPRLLRTAGLTDHHVIIVRSAADLILQFRHLSPR
jgi:hypothetical protein